MVSPTVRKCSSPVLRHTIPVDIESGEARLQAISSEWARPLTHYGAATANAVTEGPCLACRLSASTVKSTAAMPFVHCRIRKANTKEWHADESASRGMGQNSMVPGHLGLWIEDKSQFGVRKGRFFHRFCFFGVWCKNEAVFTPNVLS